jgi:protein-export membrane protein SecD
MIYIGRWTIITVVVAVALGILFAMPNFLSEQARANLPGWLPSTPLSLGLDLQGGSYVLLEVDLAGVRNDRLSAVEGDIRLRFREADPRIGYTRLGTENDTVTVGGIDPAQVDQARDILNQIINPTGIAGGAMLGLAPINEYQLRDAGNGTFAINFSPAFETQLANQILSQSIEVVRRRIDELGTREPTIQQQGSDRILVQVPGLEDTAELRAILQTTARMNFRLVDETGDLQAAIAGRVPPGSELLYEENLGQQLPILIQRRVMVSGDRLVNASAGFDQQRAQTVVNFRFDGAGARQFGDVTRANVGRRFAIVLDDRVISAPVINEPILQGSGQISGNFTPDTANQLAVLLRAGALPADLLIIEERSVGAELGADSVTAGTESAMLGFALVIVFILLSYGLFGGFASIGVAVNLILLAGVMSALQATLTLPGIAGIVLTLGMSVDANVLIYERIREEIAQGKTAIAAIDSGFRRAMSAIIDSNLTTILAALILFQLGSGPVRGFAVTLGLGIILSFFSAVMVTRLMIVLWIRRAKPKMVTL